MTIGFQEYHELPHEKKGMHLFPWCTRTQNTLGQFILTFGIHLITMVGQDIHGGAALHGPKEPSLALVWSHFESLVHGAIVSNFANFSTCTFVHVLSALMCFICCIPSPCLGMTFI